MERDAIDLPGSGAGAAGSASEGNQQQAADTARQAGEARADAPRPETEPQAGASQRAVGAAAKRRTPGTAAMRRRDRDTAAQVEEWRMRQASRAVPAQYRQGGRMGMPAQVYTPDPDVLDAQNEIPAQGIPVRTRPSIPNYTPRQEPWRVTSLDDLDDLDVPGTPRAEGTAPAPIDAGVFVDPGTGPRASAQGAADALRDSAARAGEAGAALLGNVRESEAAAKARDFAASVPGHAAAAGRRVAASLRAEDGTLRKKPLAIAAAVLVYLVFAVYFSFHYYPATSIGPVQVGNMDVAQASEALGQAVDGYVLQVEGEGGVSFTVLGSEAGLSLDAQEIARHAMEADTGLLWPIEVLLPHDHTDVMVASAGAGGFREKISDAVAWYNKDATAPKDAGIAYDKEEKAFRIVPEERGSMLDEEKIVEHVKDALATMQPVLELGEDDYVQPAVFQDDERLASALAEAEKVLETDITFTAHGSDVATLDGATAATWVTTDEDVNIALDEDQVNTWVQELVDKSSTVGAKRTWTREDGVECTVEGGTYGWEADWLAVDQALHDAIGAGTSEKVEVPMQQEAAVYGGANARDWKSYIDVDLDAQHAAFYDDAGKLLWEADFVSGSPDGEHDTPQGVYCINNKESPSLLVGEANATGSPEYQTEVQYWMAWRGNDVGFHDADWQDEFGGTRYKDGFGSHGCINLSPDDAARLYELAPVDTVVVCHSGTAKAKKKAKAAAQADAASTSADAADAPSSRAADAAEPVDASVAEEPAADEPAAEESAAEEPAGEEPTYDDPTYEDAPYDDAAYDSDEYDDAEPGETDEW